jgi:pentatricopeptide repeat protein
VQGEKLEKAWKIFPQMLKRNVLPRVVNYGMLMDGFAKQSNFRKALMLYTRMLKVGVMPDTISFKTLVLILNLFFYKNLHLLIKLFRIVFNNNA